MTNKGKKEADRRKLSESMLDTWARWYKDDITIYSFSTWALTEKAECILQWVKILTHYYVASLWQLSTNFYWSVLTKVIKSKNIKRVSSFLSSFNRKSKPLFL